MSMEAVPFYTFDMTSLEVGNDKARQEEATINVKLDVSTQFQDISVSNKEHVS